MTAAIAALMRATVVVAVLATATLAHAQPPSLTPPGAAQPAPALQAPRGKKDRRTAYFASFAGTVAPIIVMMSIGDSSEPKYPIMLFGATAILLPSAGHWYAGKLVTGGMGLRALSGIAAMLSISVLAEADDDAGAIGGIAIISLVGLGAGAVWDIATAGSAVDDWNRKHATVMPTALKLGDGYGVGLAGRF